MKFFKTVLAAVALMAIAAPSLAEGVWREGAFRGTVILTVSGNVGLPTRGLGSPEVDTVFTFNDLSFDKAAQFDVAALQALPQVLRDCIEAVVQQQGLMAFVFSPQRFARMLREAS